MSPPTAATHMPPTVAEQVEQAPKHHAQPGGNPGLGMQHAPPPGEGQGVNLLARLNRAAMTVPQNLKALVGIGSPVRLHGAGTGLAPALDTKFDGKVGALAYLILLLCYPCIATTAATARETNQRWTGFMVFWTISLGYGAAVLFYQLELSRCIHTCRRHGSWACSLIPTIEQERAMTINDTAQETTPAASSPVPASPKWLAVLGLVAGWGAVVASSCCAIPLGLAALGAGAGVLGGLEAVAEWRTPFLLISALAIIGGWGVWWLKRPVACAFAESCASPQRSRATLALLLCASITVAAAASWGYIDPALLKLFRSR